VNDASGAAIPPIGTQLTRLAELDPDRPALTCDGVTLTRAQLDSSANRLARAYRGMGVRRGDYLTIALPNSIEWLQAAFAGWKLGAIVQPLSPGLPDTEFSELLALAPRPLLVGRADPAGVIPSLPMGFAPSADLPESPLEEAISPVWKAMPSGGSTGRSKLIEATVDSCLDPAPSAMLFGTQSSEVQLVVGPLTHNTPITTSVTGLLLGQHVVLMSLRHRGVLAPDCRAPGGLDGDRTHGAAAAASGLSARSGPLRPLVVEAAVAYGRTVSARGEAGLD
jgi:bile acid-coenzyme A ligase